MVPLFGCTAFPRLHGASTSASATGASSQQRFVQVDSLPTVACAGLAAVSIEPDGTLLAAANYYGASVVFGTSGTRAAHEVQRVPLPAGQSMAHDWEIARVDEATTLLIVVGDGRSLVYLLRGQPEAPRLASAPLPCEDSAEGCAAWAAAGECARNSGFMHGTCAASCAACDASGDDLTLPLQLVPS